jgi:uracil-DNA glycosylase
MAASLPVHPADAASDLALLATRLAACRLCAGVTPPPIAAVTPGQRALIVGQAPGIHEPVLGRPFAAAAGLRLRRWFAAYGLEDEDRFRATFAMTAVAKCYPGRVPGGRGDRRPSRAELAACAPWTAAQLRLLDPVLVVPVGGMAIEQLLGPGRLADVIGTSRSVAGRLVVPLPHPSGASAWTNAPANRALVDRAVALICGALGLPPTPA